MIGKPVVAGTRITVKLILEKLAAGESMGDILDAHPQLTEAVIRAAIAFAVNTLTRTSAISSSPEQTRFGVVLVRLIGHTPQLNHPRIRSAHFQQPHAMLSEILLRR